MQEEFMTLIRACSAAMGSGSGGPTLPPEELQSTLPLAVRHGCVPLLCLAAARGVPEGARGLPPPLRNAWLLNVRDSTARVEVLAAALATLADAGVDALAVKGPTLSVLAYSDAAARACEDVDLLIRRRDLARARAALAARGYAPHSLIDGRDEATAVRVGMGRLFTAPAGAGQVDLLDGVAPAYFCWRMAEREVFGRAMAVEVYGHRFRTLCREDLLLLLAAHGCRHQWCRLIWVADVAALLGRRNVDLAATVDRARRTGALRMVVIAVSVARALFGGGAMEEAAATMPADPEAERMAERVSARLRVDPLYWPADDTSRVLEHLGYRERWRDRAAYVAKRTFQPTANDVRGIALPAPLFPLYGVLRPLRLLGRGLSAALGGPHQARRG